MEKEEIEQTNKVEIKYQDSFVAFLDVLGFTNLVKSNNTNKIDKYLESVEKMLSTLKDKLKSLTYCENMNFIIISDSIIISIPKNNINDIDILKALCLSIYSLQGYLVISDIWLRGAISSGEAYFNDEKKQIIGKAYINAYLLESKSVSNPQVAIDNKIIQELGFTNSKDFINAINEEQNHNTLYDWTGINYIKKDFPLFINYLGLFIDKNDDTEYRKITSLDALDIIINNIENNIYSHANLYTKYKWVANYALSLIEKYQGNEFNKLKERLEKL
jgi:hypothetical protein